MLSHTALVAVVSNIFFSIILVLLNKRLVVSYGFTFMTVLSGLHFATSFVVGLLLLGAKLQKYKPVNSYWSIFRISLGSLLSVVFMNYCLSQSTVGFYQVAKLFCIPLTLFFETIFGLRQEALTVRLMASLAVIVLGMMMVIREEISTNFTGFVWGVCGIVTTALSQVFFGPLKKGLGLDAFQLLFHTSPWLTFGSFCMVPFFEKTDKLIEYDLAGAVVFNVLLTCLVAVAFNISNYVVLAEISPLTYNIIGHVKTIVIIGVGSYLFHTWPSTAMLMGMVTAVVGVLLYTFEKEQQQKQQALQQGSQTDKLPAQVTRSPHGSLAALESGLGKGVSNGMDNMVSNSNATASAPAGSSGSSHVAGSAQTDAPNVKAERLHKLQQQRRDAKNIEGFLRV